MADGDDPPPQVISFRPRRKPRSEETIADAKWEIMARRDKRLGAVESEARIPRRIRWWIAAAFLVVAFVLLRDRLAEWLPWLG